MSTNIPPMGRRERNKRDKLQRITTAATELFASRGVDDVTTQEIAERADVGAGTLFLYARTKGELLLLVQNATYAAALEQGRVAAAAATSVVDGVLAAVRPVVECNRKQVDNGRTYLREIVFGDPDEPHHREALDLTAKTEELVAEVIARGPDVSDEAARTLAHVVSGIMFVSMAVTTNAGRSVDEIVHEIAGQVRAILPR